MALLGYIASDNRARIDRLEYRVSQVERSETSDRLARMEVQLVTAQRELDRLTDRKWRSNNGYTVEEK